MAKCFVGPSSSKWGVMAQDLTRIMTDARQTIQEKNLQILRIVETFLETSLLRWPSSVHFLYQLVPELTATGSAGAYASVHTAKAG